ncbi:unnamed protein product [Ectocarpus sp. CCAP 1310/34]|nr:unnamed protein product [Ectocarpus sp. CCAP 1310/34]
MKSFVRTRRNPRRRSLLLSVLVLASAGWPLAWAQVATTACGSTSSLRVETVTDAGVLSTAVNCTDGGTVEAVWAGAVTLTAPISVGTGTFLSITGEDGSAEVLGGGQTQMFYVSSSGGLTLTDLRLSGGSAASGGAIESSMASVTLDTCIFSSNVATAGDGGAVRADGGDLTIIGGEFSGNSASGNGGAVLAADAGLVIRNGTRFEGNTGVEGGGLYCSGGVESSAPSCSLSDATFTSNVATTGAEVSFSDTIETWADLYGGGAAAFYLAAVEITNSLFELNYAQVSGGGIFGGSGSSMSIDGCTINNNTTPGYGGGLVASAAMLGGGTVVTSNVADESGGGVFGWYSRGAVEMNDVTCSLNEAEENGGCFYSAGIGIVNDGTVMLDNLADAGGCVYVSANGTVNVNGGEFRGCRSTSNGGFMYVSDGGTATITGGLVANNVAERRAGVVYSSGDSNGFGGASVTIEGGTFSDNEAQELGGVIVAWGDTNVVTVTGGSFVNNTAKFYGGFIFLEEEASLSCEGATIRDHYAGDQGGGIYGRDATWVNSSCDLIGNAAPQGAAVYLTHTVMAANFTNHEVTDNVASGGSVLYATETAVFATGLNFQSGVGLQEDSSNRAIQLEGETTLVADGCVFGGWMGDTVIRNSNTAPGSLTLDSCDFSESAAVMVVGSPHSDALIRNAVVDHLTIENAALVNDSLVLVDNAFDCRTSGICAAGECVDSVLGVLCECLSEDYCLNDGGALSISLLVHPLNVTYSPDPVYFELLVSASADGVTPTIWNLSYEADDLGLQVLPSSGILPPGENVTVAITGNPLQDDVGGVLVTRFVVTSAGSGTAESSSSTGVELEVKSEFYLCQAFEYAMPVDGDDDDNDPVCLQCANFDGAEGLDCESPGATLASLPVREGYWRSSQESLVVHGCLNSDACAGGTQISSSDDYCKDCYEGPYCAVCAEGCCEGSSHTCYRCSGIKSRLLMFAGIVFGVTIVLFLGLAIVFLIGGLDAVNSMRLSMSRKLSVSGKIRGSISRSYHEGSSTSKKPSGRSNFGEDDDDDNDGRGRSAAVGDAAVDEEKTRTAAVIGLGPGDYSPERPLSTAATAAAVDRARILEVGARMSDAGGESSRTGCCGLGGRIKRWVSLLPMDKLKILVVVWQILTVFPSITGVQFPPSYSRFLSWVDVVNLDVGQVFTASCLLPSVSFYQRLLLTTLTPIGLGCVLVLTHWMAKQRAGIGSASVLARRAAWSRHMAAGLLLTFLVFTSTSTMAFKTFPCDDEAVEGESYLRADYSLSCKTDKHMYFRIYAGIMILVYPIGIPLLYAFILWINRESLNPRVRSEATPQPTGGVEMDVALVPANYGDDLEERLEQRRNNPDLVPSMFLWKDFGPDMYYYEVIECGRRILLTGVLIFFAAGTAAQAAMACIFAFVSLLGFELLRPHLDPADAWLYRLGCVIIFLSNFLALLIKVDAAGEGNRAALGGILIAVNVFLILAVLSTSWFATQQMVDDNRNEENSLALAKTMLTFEQRVADDAKVVRGKKQTPESPQSSVGAVSGRGSCRSVGPRPSAENQQQRGVLSSLRRGSVSAATVNALWEAGKTEGSSKGQERPV